MLTEWWDTYGWQIMVGGSILLLIVIFIYRLIKGENGSWNTLQYYINRNAARLTHKLPNNYNRFISRRGPPKDSKGELECRRVLRKLFNKPFNKIRPDFLRNHITDGNNNLEIDCYCHELRLGVEYNGKQHYEYIPYMHKTKDAYYNQKYRDQMKRDLCSKNGIVLIEVPYTVDISDIESYLLSHLRKNGYRV